MESGGSPCPVVDTTKTTNRSLGKRLCTNKQRHHIITCTGCLAEGFRFWSLRDRSCPWRARRRPGSRHVPPRGRHALRRPWRFQFVTRRALGGGHWRTPPSQPPQTRAPWRVQNPRPASNLEGGQQAQPIGASIGSLRPGHASSCHRCSGARTIAYLELGARWAHVPPCARRRRQRRRRLPSETARRGSGDRWAKEKLLFCPVVGHDHDQAQPI